MDALIIGGTGPTGPYIVKELANLGYRPILLHRGVHEVDEVQGYEHIHADPHFRSSLEQAVSGRYFEVVVACYGRLAVIGDVMRGRCTTLIGISGLAAYPGYFPHRTGVFDKTSWPRETLIASEEDIDPLDSERVRDLSSCCRSHEFSAKVQMGERTVIAADVAGHYIGSVLRYPMIYGPRNLTPWEWHVLRRAEAGMEAIVLPDGGRQLMSRLSARNAAKIVAEAIGYSSSRGGIVVNCADPDVYTLREWFGEICRVIDYDPEFISVPLDTAGPGRSFLPYSGLTSTHAVLSTRRLEAELQWSPEVSSIDGMRETVEWLFGGTSEDQLAWEGNIGPIDLAAERMYIDRITTQVSASKEADSKYMQMVPSTFVHPYAHPKDDDDGVDHRGR